MRESILKRLLALSDEKFELLVALFEKEEQDEQEEHRSSA